MKEYLEKSSKILDELQTTEQGLSEAEAARRLSEHGPNRLAAGKKTVLVFGGGSGSRAINDALRKNVSRLCKKYNVHL